MLKSFLYLTVLGLGVLLSPLAAPSATAAELIMIDEEGCPYCIAWHNELGPIYPKTAEGKFAPLRVVDIGDGAPDGITFARRVNFTPTFILIDNNTEVARIEGHPGEEIFWWILEKLLTDHTDFQNNGS